jgi:hypothetical protein
MVDEHVLLEQDKLFRWEGPKRKQTLFSAKLGRLMLTDQRLLFLSTGKNDVTAGRLLGGAISPIAGLRTSSTAGLDLSAADAAGGLNVPLSSIETAELKGMFKTLTVHYTDANGGPQSSTFAPKNGGMPAGAEWVDQIERLRRG